MAKPTRKPQTCWAVLSADVTDRVVHATGLNSSDALRWFKRAYGYDAALEFDDAGKARFVVRRIRWSVVTPAKKPGLRERLNKALTPDQLARLRASLDVKKRRAAR